MDTSPVRPSLHRGHRGQDGQAASGIPVYPNEAEGDQGEVVECDGEDQETEEVQESKIAPSPSLPSAAEVEDHRISHLPFRSWCRECILGKALGEQRCSKGHSPSKIAVIGVDYFYMTEKGLLSRSELSEKFPMTAEGDVALRDARRLDAARRLAAFLLPRLRPMRV